MSSEMSPDKVAQRKANQLKILLVYMRVENSVSYSLDTTDQFVDLRLSPAIFEELHSAGSHHIDAKTGSLTDVDLKRPFSRVNSYFAIANLMSQPFIGGH